MKTDDRSIGYIVIILGILFCVAFVAYLQYHLRHGHYDIEVRFPNLGILAVDDAVKVSGKQVGRVKSITRKDDKASVCIEMFAPVVLQSDYVIRDRDRGLMGDREIEMVPGRSGVAVDMSKPLQGQFVPGIADNIAIANNLNKASLELRALVLRLAHGDSVKRPLPEQIHDFLDKVDELSLKVENITTGLQEPLDKGSAKLRNISRQTRSLSNSLRKNGDGLLTQVDSAFATLEGILEGLDPLVEVTGKISHGLLNDSTFTASTFRNVSYLDTLVTQLGVLKNELSVMRREGRLNINFF